MSVLDILLLYSGRTGFILAARNGNLNILEFLLTKGASVDQKDRYGKIQPLSSLSLIKVKSKYKNYYIAFKLKIFRGNWFHISS